MYKLCYSVVSAAFSKTTDLSRRNYLKFEHRVTHDQLIQKQKRQSSLNRIDVCIGALDVQLHISLTQKSTRKLQVPWFFFFGKSRVQL